MPGEMKLALTIAATDMASRYVRDIEERIKDLGEAGKDAQRYYDEAAEHFKSAAKAMGSAYGYFKLLAEPGIKAAAAIAGCERGKYAADVCYFPKNAAPS